MKLFSPFPNVFLAFSQKTDGSFRDLQSIQQYLSDTVHYPISYLKLEHEIAIKQINSLETGTYTGDVILTNLKEQIISFVVADCYPVLIYDKNSQVLALLHCGWKSLVKGIIPKTIEEMEKSYKIVPENLNVWIGPGICPRHYIQAESPAQLEQKNWKTSIKMIEHKKYSISLNDFIHRELIQQQVKADKIYDEHVCTYDKENNLFSHRRAILEKEPNGRFFVAAWQV